MITTTVVGSFPKPACLQIPDWFGTNTTKYDVKLYNQYLKNPDTSSLILRAQQDIIQFQDGIGIDILSDGEVKRENYIHYHLRHLCGIDFEKLELVSSRNDAYQCEVPTIVGKIRLRDHFLFQDWQESSQFTSKPVKITLPGPMTIMDTVSNQYYTCQKDLYEDLSDCLNQEIKHVVEQGCTHIQVDEPLFARKPEEAIQYGIPFLDRIFDDIPSHVEKIVHICCGYPDRVGETDYPKADIAAYHRIMPALNQSRIDTISIEDAHRPNTMDLFSKIDKKVILGVVNISHLRVESVEEIFQRGKDVLQYIPAHRLILSPDCGLGMLPLKIIEEKLHNMVMAKDKLNLVYT